MGDPRGKGQDSKPSRRKLDESILAQPNRRKLDESILAQPRRKGQDSKPRMKEPDSKSRSQDVKKEPDSDFTTIFNIKQKNKSLNIETEGMTDGLI